MKAKLVLCPWFRVLPLGLATVGLTQPSCKPSSEYAHLDVTMTLANLTPEQRALVHDIVIESQVDGNKDPTRIHRVSFVPAQLDKSFATSFDYIPDPQSGKFVVTAVLSDKTSKQLAKQSKDTEVSPKSTAHVSFDFDSAGLMSGPCKLEMDATELTPNPDWGLSVNLLWDGDHYLVIYDDKAQGDGDLASVKLDANGKAISPPVFINSSPKVSTLPSIIKDGNGYVVAWQEGELDDQPPVSVDIRRLDANGAPVGNIREIATASPEARPVLASAYGKIALTWMDDRGTATMPDRISYVAYLKSDDFSFEQSPLLLVPPSQPPGAQNAFPALSMNGQSLAVSWVNASQTVYTANLSDALALSPPLQLYTSMFIAQQLGVVSTGDQLFTAWEDLSGDIDKGRERIHGVFSTSAGALGAGGYVHDIDTGSANWPRMAWSGTSVATVYYQYRTFGSQIYLTRENTKGERIDGMDIQLTDVAGEAKYPQIVFRGNDLSGDHFGLGFVSDHTGKQRAYFAPVVCSQ